MAMARVVLVGYRHGRDGEEEAYGARRHGRGRLGSTAQATTLVSLGLAQRIFGGLAVAHAYIHRGEPRQRGGGGLGVHGGGVGRGATPWTPPSPAAEEPRRARVKGKQRR